MGVVFSTLTIPLAFDGHWTAAIWGLEAAGIYWVSLRQNRLLGRVFSSVLSIAAGFTMLTHHSDSTASTAASLSLDSIPFLNSFYMGCMLISLGALAISFVGYKNRSKLKVGERWTHPLLFIYGTLWWTLGGTLEVANELAPWLLEQANHTLKPYSRLQDWRVHLVLVYLGLGTLKGILFARRFEWRWLNYWGGTFILIMALGAVVLVEDLPHAAALGGWLVWPFLFGVYYFCLKSNELLKHNSVWFRKMGHSLSLWLMVALGGWEADWCINQLHLAGSA